MVTQQQTKQRQTRVTSSASLGCVASHTGLQTWIYVSLAMFKASIILSCSSLHLLLLQTISYFLVWKLQKSGTWAVWTLSKVWFKWLHRSTVVSRHRICLPEWQCSGFSVLFSLQPLLSLAIFTSCPIAEAVVKQLLLYLLAFAVIYSKVVSGVR